MHFALLIISLIGAFGGTVGALPVTAGGRDDGGDIRDIRNAVNGERLGQLPTAVSFGASAQTPDGLVMAGGCGSRRVWLLDGKCKVHQLPSLPCPVDSAAACAIGSTIYIAGGNLDGTPSTALLCLDTADRRARWRKVADMPGLPRLLPVMAAAGGKLYIWGGFCQTPDTTAIAPTGLCFDPGSGQWAEVNNPSPSVSLTGGFAHAWSDGSRIVCGGGYNTRALLCRLNNPGEYFAQHPVKWYRQNGAAYIFHPLDGTWSAIPAKADRARVNAATALLLDGGVMIMGGQLAPNVLAPLPTVL